MMSVQVSEEVSVHAGGPYAVSAAHQGSVRDAVLLRGRVDAVQRWDSLSAARQSCGQLHPAVSHWSEFSRNQTDITMPRWSDPVQTLTASSDLFLFSWWTAVNMSWSWWFSCFSVRRACAPICRNVMLFFSLYVHRTDKKFSFNATPSQPQVHTHIHSLTAGFHGFT